MCTAHELIAMDDGSQGATGHVVTSITLAASGTSACFLDGTPSVTLLDSAGDDLAFKQHDAYFPASVLGRALLEPGPPPDPHMALKAGQASLSIDWVSQPEACLGEAPAAIAGARISTPGGGAVTVEIASVPAAYACQGLGVSSFEGLSMPVEKSPPPPLPSASLTVPSSAHAGRAFRYLVTLTNHTAVSIDLVANCPNYFEALITPAHVVSFTGKQFYRLNCAPAGTLAPGRSATFEIKLDVPADVQHGPYSLAFTLGNANALGKPSSPSVQVTVN
ncbi:MAG: DUF4232 domain-containing protein [Candidatus Dormibacteraceae bacterium]